MHRLADSLRTAAQQFGTWAEENAADKLIAFMRASFADSSLIERYCGDWPVATGSAMSAALTGH